MSARLSKRTVERHASMRERQPAKFVGDRERLARHPRTRVTGHNAGKRGFMAQARRAGWRGRSYRKAKRFERALERAIAAEKVGAR